MYIGTYASDSEDNRFRDACSLPVLVWIIQVEVDNEKFELRLWDTAGQEAYEELRKQVDKMKNIQYRYMN